MKVSPPGMDLSGIQSMIEHLKAASARAQGKVSPLSAVEPSKKLDFADALKAGANAVAAGNIFTYTEHSVALIKRQLAQAGVDLRIDSTAAYENAGFDADGRLQRQDEELLEDLLFVRIHEEVI